MSSQSSSRVPPTNGSTAIRLFSPDEQVGADQLRLRDFYEAHLKPYLVAEKQSKPGTFKAYEEAISHWESITVDPPIAAVTKPMLSDYGKSLAEIKGRKGAKLSPSTVVKHCKSVRAILVFAGPPTGKQPDAVGALDVVPFARLPKTPRKKPKHVMHLDELGLLLDACERMTTPELAYCTASDWWHGILIADYYTSWRIGTLRSLEFAHIRDGLFVVDDPIFKCQDSDEKIVHPMLLAAIERIRSPRRFIFEWPHCTRHLYRTFDQLMCFAGISEERRKWMKFHGIRKRHCTQAALISPLAAQLSLGHTSQTTGMQHYISPAEITGNMIMQLPPPPRKRDDGQRDLFDKHGGKFHGDRG